MNMNQAVNDWLLQKQIKVPAEWLDACLDWLSSENPGQPNDRGRMQAQVYEQWLMTDIAELGSSSLPSDVNSEKYTLNGRYCLQINSVIDTSQSYYSQLLDVRGENQSNTNVTAETQSTQFTQRTQMNSSRLLMMELTDGTMNLHGIEFQPVSCLHSKINPGTKIRVKGPIMCRKGVLMLKSSNLEVLGGEIESTSSNTPEAVLCKALNIPIPNNQNENQNDAFDEDELPSDILSQLVDGEFDNVPDVQQDQQTNNHNHQDNNRQNNNYQNNNHQANNNRNLLNDNTQQTNRNTSSHVPDNYYDVSVMSSPPPNATILSTNNFDDFDNELDDIITSHDFLADADNSRVEQSKIMSYLCDIKQKNTPDRYIVKAFIMTLLSKLTSEQGDGQGGGWKLSARICDGTDYLDVEFSNHFLTKLIGFSSQQANEIKSGCDPSKIESLKQGMAKCRKCIVETCQLMTLDYKSHQLSSIFDVVSPQSELFPHIS